MLNSLLQNVWFNLYVYYLQLNWDLFSFVWTQQGNVPQWKYSIRMKVTPKQDRVQLNHIKQQRHVFSCVYSARTRLCIAFPVCVIHGPVPQMTFCRRLWQRVSCHSQECWPLRLPAVPALHFLTSGREQWPAVTRPNHCRWSSANPAHAVTRSQLSPRKPNKRCLEHECSNRNNVPGFNLC